MSLFPKPVYWIMQRAPDQPFAETHPHYSTLHRVGNRDDMVELLKRERIQRLRWSAGGDSPEVERTYEASAGVEQECVI
jgi:hypothetical protein